MCNPLRPESLRPLADARAAARLALAAGARGLLMSALLLSAFVAGSAHGSPTRLHFVLQAGDASYVVLAPLEEGEALPPHGPVGLVGEPWAPRAIAEVAEAGLPAHLRAWSEREVVVDEHCRARVTGFALVARLHGEPGYAGHSASEWTADSVLSAGHKVLAARLTGCTGRFARAADAAPISVPRPVRDEAAVASARADFLASDALAQAREELVDAGFEGALEQADALRVMVVRHPTTGESWVSLHLRIWESCFGPQASLWGLYRVTARGVERTRLLPLGSVERIEALVDLEGDGQLELLTHGEFGFDRELRTDDGEVIDRLTMPFYGCLC